MTEYINRERARFEAKRYFKNMDEIQEDLDMLFCMLPAENVATVQEWISVKDRLPEKNHAVLGWCKDNPFAGYTYEVVSWNGRGWVFVYAQRYVTNVTHWQPMPEPPEEGRYDM